MNRASLLLSLGLLLAAVGPARAELIRRTALSGVPLKLAHFASVNPDCTTKGRTEVRIANSPAHGVVRTRKALDYSRFQQFTPSSGCDFRRVVGTSLTFQSEKGFVGTDYVTVDVIYPSGFERNDTYEITVK